MIEATDSRTLVRECARLSEEQRTEEALAVLGNAIRAGHLPPEEFEAAGRLLSRMFTEPRADLADVSVLIVGQCTTSWLSQALTATGWGHGIATRVQEGAYDTVIQDLADLSRSVDIVVIVPWHQRLLSDDGRSSQTRLDDELQFMRQAWGLVRTRRARLVQVGYDWVGPGPLGYGLGGRAEGDVGLVREANSRIRAELPEGAYLVDLERVSATMGHRNFYDARNYFWTKQPFSRAGVRCLAQHIWAGIRAVTTGPKKVLVVDLDNTLWGGVVGDLGPHAIELGDGPAGEAFRAFQAHLKGLRRRGVILAVCSKNNPDDAREPFEKNPQMLLALSDFAAFEASWDAKPLALRRIAETLRLGTDSFVFFDDNAGERDHVRQALPEVAVVEVPPDPADYVSALQEELWFEAVAITDVDQQRGDQYLAEQRRRDSERKAVSVEGYLESLVLQAEIEPIAAPNMQRVVQLLGRTNQFNLTNRRHTAEEVRRLLEDPGSLGLALRLRDRFGDYGLISVVLATPFSGRSGADTTLRLDTWLMSCRAIGRTVEEYVMNWVALAARRLGCKTLVGEYYPTAKNVLVADMYTRFAFEPCGSAEDGGRRFRLSLDDFQRLPTFVHELAKEESMTAAA